MSTSRRKELCIPEDVVHLIFKEILFQGDRDAFHTAALISSIFLYVAHRHLYRSYKLNIRDPNSTLNLRILLGILDRRPHIRAFVKEFHIVDLHYPRKLHTSSVVPELCGGTVPVSFQPPLERICPDFVDLFIENKHNLLPRLCGVLSSLSTLNFSFPFGQLSWSILHEGVQGALVMLMGLEQLMIVRFNGVSNIPRSVAIQLVDLLDIEINNCHFNSFPSIAIPHQKSRTPCRWNSNLRRLSLGLGHPSPNYDAVFRYWLYHGMQMPQVEELFLSVDNWYGGWDAAIILRFLGNHVKELSLSTTRLQLGFMLHQPPQNPFLCPAGYACRLPRLFSHKKGTCFATDDFDQLTSILTHQLRMQRSMPLSFPYWFPELMSPLRPCSHPQSFQSLQTLTFEISHWRSALEAEENGEFFWVISWLAELPSSKAENVKELTIVIHVGTDFCLDNPNAMQELVEYQGWTLLDMIIVHPNWRGLERVRITVRSRATCLYGTDQKFTELLEWLKKSMLPRSSSRGILDVSFVPLGSSASPSD